MARPERHRKRWKIRWFDEFGKRHYETYDAREMAEVMLQRHHLHVKEVQLALRTGYCPSKTFRELAEFWLTTYAPNKRSFKDDESIIKQHLLPVFGPMPLKTIRQQHVEAFRLARGHLSPKTVLNHVILLKTMLNRAADMGWLEAPPRIKAPRVPTDTQDFSYLRTEGEIRRLLMAAKTEGLDAFMLYKTAIFSGLRAGELAGLLWTDVDFANRIITVQRSYDGPTKNARIRRVPIFDAILPDLQEWALLRPSNVYVFPNRHGGMLGPSARIFQEIFHRVLKRAEFPMVLRGRREAHYVRFHDLRHTFASHFVMNGGNMFTLQKILGHQSIDMTMRYSHLAPQAFTKEYGRFGGHDDLEEGTVHKLERDKLRS
jgi:integrase